MSTVKQGARLAAESGSKLKAADKVLLGVNALGAFMDYRDARKEGSSVPGAIVKSAGLYAFNEVAGWGGLALSLAAGLPGAAVQGIESISKYQREMNRSMRRIPFVNSNFQDFKQAYTMRQAGMQLAENSQYHLQQAMLGNEAQYLK